MEEWHIGLIGCLVLQTCFSTLSSVFEVSEHCAGVVPTHIHGSHAPHSDVYLIYTVTSVYHARQCAHNPRQSHAPNSRRNISHASSLLTRDPAQPSMQLRWRRRGWDHNSYPSPPPDAHKTGHAATPFGGPFCRSVDTLLPRPLSLSNLGRLGRLQLVRMRQAPRHCHPAVSRNPVIHILAQPRPHGFPV